MKLSLASSILLCSMLFISSLSFADAPGACPAISTIKTVGLNPSYTEREPDLNGFLVGNLNNYSTQQTWVFAILVPFSAASSNAAAFTAAKSVLPSLSGNPQPVAVQDDNGTTKYECEYNINKFIALAIEPVGISSVMSRNVKIKAHI